MKKALAAFLPVLAVSALGQTPRTTIAMGYDGGTLGVANAITIAMEDRVIAELGKLFNVTKSYVNIPCSPSIGNPKKICVEFSERWAAQAGQWDGYSVFSPPSLLAGVVKSKAAAWVNKQVAEHPDYPAYIIGQGLAVLPIHEIGHSCGVAGDYAQSPTTQQYYMARPTSSTYAKEWKTDERDKIVVTCSPTVGPPPPSGAAVDKIPDLPVPPQSISFAYIPGPNPITDLGSRWNFSDVNAFAAVQTNEGFAPPGYHSTYMTKNAGTNSGWATTPVFTAVDRTQTDFTLHFKANWSYTNSNPLSGSNYLCASLARWNGSSFSYDYNFYYRPKNWADAYETNDYQIYKNGFSTLVGQSASHDYSTWTGDWVAYKIQIDKVQSAGGSGQIRFYGYHPQYGWRLLTTVVDNQYTTFNAVDVWHSTDPSAETWVQIDDVVVQKGVK